MLLYWIRYRTPDPTCARTGLAFSAKAAASLIGWFDPSMQSPNMT